MNYHEAKNQLLESEKIVQTGMTYSKPSRYIMGKFIAPRTKRNQKDETIIYTQVIENHQLNDIVLTELGLINEDLAVFLVVKMWGYLFTVELETYLEHPMPSSEIKP